MEKGIQDRLGVNLQRERDLDDVVRLSEQYAPSTGDRKIIAAHVRREGKWVEIPLDMLGIEPSNP